MQIYIDNFNIIKIYDITVKWDLYDFIFLKKNKKALTFKMIKKTQNTFKSKKLIFTMFMHGAILHCRSLSYLFNIPPPTLNPQTLPQYGYCIDEYVSCYFFSFSLYSIQQQEVGAKESIILNNYTGVFFSIIEIPFIFIFFIWTLILKDIPKRV